MLNTPWNKNHAAACYRLTTSVINLYPQKPSILLLIAEIIVSSYQAYYCHQNLLTNEFSQEEGDYAGRNLQLTFHAF